MLENALHHTGADAKFPADLEDAVTAGLQFANSCLYGGLNPTPAELDPIRLARGAFDPRSDVISGQRLSESPDLISHPSSGRTGSKVLWSNFSLDVAAQRRASVALAASVGGLSHFGVTAFPVLRLTRHLFLI